MKTTNPLSKAINQKQGPRTGNMNPGGKRAAFKEGKVGRSALADSIEAAYGARKMEDKVNPKLEGISPDTKPKKFKR